VAADGAERKPSPLTATIRIEAFGAHLEVSAPGEDELAAIAAELPGAVAVELATGRPEPDHRLRVAREGSGFVVRGDDARRYDVLSAALAEAVSQLHFQIALHARDAIFLHAGAVCFEDRLILIPGRTRAGKSTLTVALVEAGGEYYSDEYAPIDRDGRVLPYRKRPSVRPGSPVSEPAPVASAEPPPRWCDLVLGCEFSAGASFSPVRLTDGQGALLLVANAVVAQTRPAATAQAVASVMRRAVAYRTARPTVGETIDGVRRLISGMGERALSGGSP